MNFTGSKETLPGCEPGQVQFTEKIRAGLQEAARRAALIGTADTSLAQRLCRELERSIPRQDFSLASSLQLLRDAVKASPPSVIFLDSDLLGGMPFQDFVRQLAAAAPVLLLASLNVQADIAALVADERVDFIARVGDFVPLASALIARAVRRPPAAGITPEQPAAISDLFRHEINNPLTGILGNAELVLAHKDHFSGVEVQRLQTVVDLAVRLRENIRRISTAWEGTTRPRVS
jgi:signal transduction histidine kinase